MAEPTFETPIMRRGSTGSALTDESATTKTIIRAAPDSPAATQMGVGFGASRRVEGVLICGSRPDEWLMLGEPSAHTPPIDTMGHVSVVDFTHGRALMRLTTDHAAAVLEKVCSLDLSEAMTPDGAVVSASVAKVSCDLIRDDVDGTRSYLIACDRSFGDYLFGAILDGCDEFGVA